MTIGSKKRFGRKVTRKERQKKYSIDERIILTKENQNDFKILVALYFYRALSSDQLYRLGATDMKKNTLWSKLFYLTERRVIKTITDNDKPTGALYSKHRYVLTDLGLEVILDALSIPRSGSGRGVVKYHYTLDDLRLGSQKKHHYLSVDWISRVQQKIREAGTALYVPDSEWRRFYKGDPKGSTNYKPDWIMYEPNIGSKAIVESERYELHPFLYPLTTRDEILSKLYQTIGDGQSWDWRSFFKLMLVLEMDTGSMNHKELSGKYRAIKDSMQRDDSFPKAMVFVNYVERFSPRFNKELEDNIVLDIMPNSRKRLRNTRRNMLDVLKPVLLSDELIVLHGDEYETIYAASDYIVNNQQMIGHMKMSHISSIRSLLEENREHQMRDAQIYDPITEAGRVWKDLTAYGAGLPDLYILEDAEAGSNERFEASKPKSVDFIYFARKCWVNPQAKALEFSKWLSVGERWPDVARLRVILLYPTRQEFLDDIYPIRFGRRVLIASFEDVKRVGKWGTAFIREPVHKKGFRWVEVQEGELYIGEEESDDSDSD